MDIRKIRLSRNLTQSELACLIGVDRSTVAKWETGEALPRSEKLPLLAKALRCKIDNFFCNKA